MKVIETAGYKKIAYSNPSSTGGDYNTQNNFPGYPTGKDEVATLGPQSDESSEDGVIKNWFRKKKAPRIYRRQPTRKLI